MPASLRLRHQVEPLLLGIDVLGTQGTRSRLRGPVPPAAPEAGLGAEVSLADFRKDIIIEMYNEAGQLAIAYKVFRCWVSEFQALPELDANANAVAIQSIKLENEGWIRDVEVTEPTEPALGGA